MNTYVSIRLWVDMGKFQEQQRGAVATLSLAQQIDTQIFSIIIYCGLF
jgi:hypothetical protein